MAKRPNHPGERPLTDNVRLLQRHLWVAAKRSPERRFHALLDRIYRRDVLWEAWRRVKKNRGWGQYFRTGNATAKFIQIDRYVEERLRGLLLKRAGPRLRPGRAAGWNRLFFEALGLHRLRGTIQYPEAA